MKKNLATRLRERTETIEYRSLLKRLNVAAQNRQTTFRVLKLDADTITRLQNEGIKVERVTEPDAQKWLLSW